MKTTAALLDIHLSIYINKVSKSVYNGLFYGTSVMTFNKVAKFY